MESKKQNDIWEAYIESGREHTGINVENWVKTVSDLGAGEILITSVDREGTNKGYDTELLKLITNKTNLPVIASGGFGKLKDIKEALIDSKVDAIAIADAIHYNKFNIRDIRSEAFPEFVFECKNVHIHWIIKWTRNQFGN